MGQKTKQDFVDQDFSSTEDSFALQQLRLKILDCALAHVAQNGWTSTVLTRAVQDCECDRHLTSLLFPDGVIGLIGLFNQKADEALADSVDRSTIEKMRIRDRIRFLVRRRLEQNAAHRIAIRRGFYLLCLPPHLPAATRMVYRTVDTIWWLAGDQATDFNFYTKRMLLAVVYGNVVRSWMHDDSEENNKSWELLDAQIENIMKIQKYRARLPDPGKVIEPILRFAARIRYGAQ